MVLNDKVTREELVELHDAAQMLGYTRTFSSQTKIELLGVF
ncbi:hypothetical protein MNB_SM-4-1781 [hydrothermal vent metagenome]|uniref:Uncharacterized protein n=1 Tax=hydrothermal vent metagenome TaxID=652676 RepID=A0A1W1C9D9_9ZZZZ